MELGAPEGGGAAPPQHCAWKYRAPRGLSCSKSSTTSRPRGRPARETARKTCGASRRGPGRVRSGALAVFSQWRSTSPAPTPAAAAAASARRRRSGPASNSTYFASRCPTGCEMNRVPPAPMDGPAPPAPPRPAPPRPAPPSAPSTPPRGQAGSEGRGGDEQVRCNKMNGGGRKWVAGCSSCYLSSGNLAGRKVSRPSRTRSTRFTRDSTGTSMSRLET